MGKMDVAAACTWTSRCPRRRLILKPQYLVLGGYSCSRSSSLDNERLSPARSVSMQANLSPEDPTPRPEVPAQTTPLHCPVKLPSAVS